MPAHPRTPISVDNANLLQARVDELRRQLQDKPAELLARLSGARFTLDEQGVSRLELEFWGRPIWMRLPQGALEASGSPAPVNLPNTALVLYYLNHADGTPSGSAWVAFSELPDGRFYAQAFQGYTGKSLAAKFGADPAAFSAAAKAAGGEPTAFGELAFRFPLFPRVSLLAVRWEGDEDFSANYQILFSAAASHYLPTDACAIAGSMLTRRIITAG
ncbi:MAG: DUF3786 domain-containing protein [Anaerolineales bacterium]|nr:DUF3786 domain-containing protein [Anaerolineales bacterium]